MSRLMLSGCLLVLTCLVQCGKGGSSGGDGGGVATQVVAGHVLTGAGAPVAGVKVTAFLTNEHTYQTATTDSAGAYGFTLARSGSTFIYEVWAERSGMACTPTLPAGGATIRRSDANGLVRTVITFSGPAGGSFSTANFVASDGKTGLVSLPATGQQVSYVTGDDGDLRRGWAVAGARFTDNGNGTVLDRLTGLIWLKDAGVLGTAHWAEALAAVNALASGTAGLSDGSTAGQWRLPNLQELETLVDAAASAPALPAGHPFVGVGDAYWSSTTYFGMADNAWVIRFLDGRTMNDTVTNVKATAFRGIWPVRTGPAGQVLLPATGQFRSWATGDDGALLKGVAFPCLRFIDNQNGTVTDSLTGLVWLKKADAFNLPWADAVAAIRNLASGQQGLTDGSVAGMWRMPNRKELLSLADRCQGNHAQDFSTNYLNEDGSLGRAPVFTGFLTAVYYWSSTTVSTDTTRAWTVYSCDLGCYDISKTATGYALAVR